jgi:hypothetical protein
MIGSGWETSGFGKDASAIITGTGGGGLSSTEDTPSKASKRVSGEDNLDVPMGIDAESIRPVVVGGVGAFATITVEGSIPL